MSDVREPLPWGKSTATEAVLEQLVADRLLPMNISLEPPAWIPLRPEETEPNPPEGYIVSDFDFILRVRSIDPLILPTSAFPPRLLAPGPSPGM